MASIGFEPCNEKNQICRKAAAGILGFKVIKTNFLDVPGVSNCKGFTTKNKKIINYVENQGGALVLE